MIKAVFFDMDGTIGDTLPLIITAFREAVEPRANRRVSDDEILATFGPSEEGTIMALIPGHYDEGVKAYHESYTKHHGAYARPFDGLAEIFDYIKSKRAKLCIVTGKGAVSAAITLKVYGMENLFDAIETGRPEDPCKPDGMRRLLDRFGLQPDEAVYVGDAPSDVTSAQEAGVAAISAAWAPTADIDALKKKNPAATFESVDAFGAYIRSLL